MVLKYDIRGCMLETVSPSTLAVYFQVPRKLNKLHIFLSVFNDIISDLVNIFSVFIKSP